MIADYRQKAQTYLALSLTSPDFSRRQQLQQEYKTAQSKLSQNITQLKRFLHSIGQTDQKPLITELNEIAKQVNAHDRDLSRAVKKAAHVRIEQATLKAVEEVSEKTVGQLLNSIINPRGLPTTTHPMLTDISSKSLITSHDGALVQLAKTGELVDIEGHQLDLETALSLPISQLPATSQIALMGAAMQDLATRAESESQRALIIQMGRALQKSAQGLASGELTHLSILVEMDGKLQTFSIHRDALLSNPVASVASLGKMMFDAGVSDHQMVVTFTNPVTNQALIELAGSKPQALLTGEPMDVSENALVQVSDVVARAQSSHDLIQLFQRFKIQPSSELLALESELGAAKPLDIEQVSQLLLSGLLVTRAIQLAQDPKADLRLSDQTHSLLGRGLFSPSGLDITRVMPVMMNEQTIPMITMGENLGPFEVFGSGVEDVERMAVTEQAIAALTLTGDQVKALIANQSDFNKCAGQFSNFDFQGVADDTAVPPALISQAKERAQALLEAVVQQALDSGNKAKIDQIHSATNLNDLNTAPIQLDQGLIDALGQTVAIDPKFKNQTTALRQLLDNIETSTDETAVLALAARKGKIGNIKAALDSGDATILNANVTSAHLNDKFIAIIDAAVESRILKLIEQKITTADLTEEQAKSLVTNKNNLKLAKTDFPGIKPELFDALSINTALPQTVKDHLATNAQRLLEQQLSTKITTGDETLCNEVIAAKTLADLAGGNVNLDPDLIQGLDGKPIQVDPKFHAQAAMKILAGEIVSLGNDSKLLLHISMMDPITGANLKGILDSVDKGGNELGHIGQADFLTAVEAVSQSSLKNLTQLASSRYYEIQLIGQQVKSASDLAALKTLCDARDASSFENALGRLISPAFARNINPTSQFDALQKTAVDKFFPMAIDHASTYPSTVTHQERLTVLLRIANSDDNTIASTDLNPLISDQIRDKFISADPTMTFSDLQKQQALREIIKANVSRVQDLTFIKAILGANDESDIQNAMAREQSDLKGDGQAGLRAKITNQVITPEVLKELKVLARKQLLNNMTSSLGALNTDSAKKAIDALVAAAPTDGNDLWAVKVNLGSGDVPACQVLGLDQEVVKALDENAQAVINHLVNGVVQPVLSTIVDQEPTVLKQVSEALKADGHGDISADNYQNALAAIDKEFGTGKAYENIGQAYSTQKTQQKAIELKKTCLAKLIANKVDDLDEQALDDFIKSADHVKALADLFDGDFDILDHLENLDTLRDELINGAVSHARIELRQIHGQQAQKVNDLFLTVLQHEKARFLHKRAYRTNYPDLWIQKFNDPRVGVQQDSARLLQDYAKDILTSKTFLSTNPRWKAALQQNPNSIDIELVQHMDPRIDDMVKLLGVDNFKQLLIDPAKAKIEIAGKQYPVVDFQKALAISNHIFAKPNMAPQIVAILQMPDGPNKQGALELFHKFYAASEAPTQQDIDQLNNLLGLANSSDAFKTEDIPGLTKRNIAQRFLGGVEHADKIKDTGLDAIKDVLQAMANGNSIQIAPLQEHFSDKQTFMKFYHSVGNMYLNFALKAKQGDMGIRKRIEDNYTQKLKQAKGKFDDKVSKELDLFTIKEDSWMFGLFGGSEVITDQKIHEFKTRFASPASRIAPGRRNLYRQMTATLEDYLKHSGAALKHAYDLIDEYQTELDQINLSNYILQGAEDPITEKHRQELEGLIKEWKGKVQDIEGKYLKLLDLYRDMNPEQRKGVRSQVIKTAGMQHIHEELSYEDLTDEKLAELLQKGNTNQINSSSQGGLANQNHFIQRTQGNADVRQESLVSIGHGKVSVDVGTLQLSEDGRSNSVKNPNVKTAPGKVGTRSFVKATSHDGGSVEIKAWSTKVEGDTSGKDVEPSADELKRMALDCARTWIKQNGLPSKSNPLYVVGQDTMFKAYLVMAVKDICEGQKKKGYDESGIVIDQTTKNLLKQGEGWFKNSQVKQNYQGADFKTTDSFRKRVTEPVTTTGDLESSRNFQKKFDEKLSKAVEKQRELVGTQSDTEIEVPTTPRH